MHTDTDKRDRPNLCLSLYAAHREANDLYSEDKIIMIVAQTTSIMFLCQDNKNITDFLMEQASSVITHSIVITITFVVQLLEI